MFCFSGSRPDLQTLRTCVSTLALAAAIGSTGTILQATDYTGVHGPIDKLSKSANGANGKTSFWGSITEAEAGNDGGSMDDRVLGTVGDKNKTGTQVRLETEGGSGGKGADNGATRFGGGDGGNGGKLEFEQLGKIVTKSRWNQSRQTPLIQLDSTGGRGGHVPKLTFGPGGLNGIKKGAHGGVGGDGGQVDLVIGSDTGVIGRRYALARAISQGGAGGRGNMGNTKNVGGDGGDVTGRIKADGTGKKIKVSTYGHYAPVLVLQSIGGVGGAGPDLDYKGARGGPGGNGGDVLFTTDKLTQINSNGESSAGVVLMSVGGEGGAHNGGGVSGGHGGDAGTVKARLRGEIRTKGDFAFGLVAQSVGGRGQVGGKGTFSGGDGGHAGLAGQVEIENFGLIKTDGTGASAIVAQSVGGGDPMRAFDYSAGLYTPGGGGNGGDTSWWSLFFGKGGDGGKGAPGNRVIVENSGTIETHGTAAHGIQAQSIGGNGGDGGDGKSNTPILSIAIGGTGGGGGDGGEVFIGDAKKFRQPQAWMTASASSIRTLGGSAYGILGQSVGGGGGAGGAAQAAAASAVIPAISVAVGGSGGKGGDGKEANLSNLTDITTQGTASTAILMQSIGGGGGDAGGADAESYAVSADKVPAVSISVAVGGSGGKGGDGGRVLIQNRAGILTMGDDANGIEAQSIGGGGGNAGDVSSYALASQITEGAPAVSIPVSIGGSGGVAGKGGTVSIKTVDSVIETRGSKAAGIVARSIGGGGGSAGATSATGDLLSFSNSVSASVAIGGSGKSGGEGGKVTISSEDTTIRTASDFSHAIYGISVGGGGGDGGLADASAGSGLSADWATEYGIDTVVGLLDMKADHVTTSVAVGGSGGKGGDGGRVAIEGIGDIRTTGGGSHAVFAQSVGGGGGNGGSFAGDVNQSFMDMGGFDIVLKTLGDVMSYNDIAKTFADTDKKNSIFNGDSRTQTQFDNLGALVDLIETVEGMDADDRKKALQNFAQGFSKAEVLVLTSVYGKKLKNFQKKLKKTMNGADPAGKTKDLIGVELNVSVGGSGGKGGKGGHAKVRTDGADVTTTGLNSFGILAQSIGGGGGSSGAAYASGTQMLNADVSVGGSGGKGGNGGKVEIDHNRDSSGKRSNLLTTGDGSHGLYGQSVGGGGGFGGASQSDNTISFSVAVTVGGNEGAEGDGGTVDVRNNSNVTTAGAAAHGMIGQSVGGGGGAYFVNIYDPESLTEKTGEAVFAERAAEASEAVERLLTDAGLIDQDTPENFDIEGGEALFNEGSTVLPKPQITVTLGGDGGASGDGGEVYLKNTGKVMTEGDGSIGMFAQSVGGGGGSGKNATGGGFLSIPFDTKTSMTDYTLGGTGGAAGDGGNITVELGRNGTVATQGDGAHGILAQSVGGGGGYGGVGTTTMLYGSVELEGDRQKSGSSGDGGDINIFTQPSKSGASDMRIATRGMSSHGIWAQSLGGGGGAVTVLNPASEDGTTATDRSDSSGTGGAITIDTAGTIQATGKNSHAIFAQSGFQLSDGSLKSGTDLGDTITITHSGLLTGGSGIGAAIHVDGGNEDNAITIAKGSTVSARSGLAVYGSFGNEMLINNGSIVGDIKLNGGRSKERNWFYNNAGAYYQSRANGIVDLGYSSGHVFSNAGDFGVGAEDEITKVKIDGNLVVEDSGRLLIDVRRDDAGGLSNDRINVTRDVTFKQGSTVRPNVIGDLQKNDTFTVVTAGRKMTGTPGTSGYSPFRWGYEATSKNELKMQVAGLNFGNAGMTGIEDDMVVSWTRAWEAGNVGASAFFGALSSVETQEEFDDAVESLSPDSQMQPAANMTISSQAALNSALSCPSFDEDTLVLVEGQCVWLRQSYQRSETTESAEHDGYTDQSRTFRFGGQMEVAPDWFLGTSIGVTNSWGHSSDRYTTVEGDRTEVAVALKHQIGPWLVAGAAEAGYGTYDLTNTFDVGDDIWVGRASPDVKTAGFRARASYEFTYDKGYLRPVLDLDAVFTSMSGYQMDGDTLDLQVHGINEWTYAAHPGIEAGTRVDLNANSWMRLYSKVGMTFLSNAGLTSDVTAHDNGAEAFRFRSSTALPDTMFDFTAGVQFMSNDKFELRGEYNAKLGDHFESQSATLRLAVRF